ncbi:CPBP family intramembrane glutamic endopeptidase [Parasphingorhabdus sp.]|uniref:CPBP family intramembrane glutamic endopeptidase n=1 Tax=Parasphingorhabdus sp. TaxID=2709688 RepID=UPI003A8E9C1C
MTAILSKLAELNVAWRLLIFAVLLILLVSPLLLLSSSLLQFLFAAIILTVLMVAWSRRVDRRSIRDYGLEPSGAMVAELAAGLTIGTASVALMFLLVTAPGGLASVSFQNHAFDSAFGLFFLKTALVAYWEETVFRGFLLINLKNSFSTRWGKLNGMVAAVGASSLLFGIIHSGTNHFSALAFAILTLNGAVWCVPILLTGRLGLSVGLHASWNFSQSKIFGFAMSGNAAEDALFDAKLSGWEIWTGGAYGPEGGLLGIVGLMAMLALIIGYALLARKFRR